MVWVSAYNLKDPGVIPGWGCLLLSVLSCYTGPPDPAFMTVTAGQSPRTICGTADGPPDQLWHRGWSPFSTAAAGPRIIQRLLILFIEP